MSGAEDPPARPGPGQDADPGPPDDTPPDDTPPDDTRQVRRGRLRRAPRFGPFITTGVVVGAVLALLPAVLLPTPATYSTGTVAGYFVAVGGLLGAVVGAALAVLADRTR